VIAQQDTPNEGFTEEEMIGLWNKYADQLSSKGFKIMESLMRISVPKLSGTTIVLELPNEGSKIDFEADNKGLVHYLKKQLNNYDITIEVVVNETVTAKRVYNDRDRIAHLLEINPNLDLLRTTFGLDFNI
jgi:hypothetical protein